MNRADRLHAVLQDGRKRTRREIFEAAGCFFMTNNAAAELRARGIDVVHTREGRVDCYQLREPDGSSGADGSGSRSGSQSSGHRDRQPGHVPTSADGPPHPDRRVSQPEGAAVPLFETEAA